MKMWFRISMKSNHFIFSILWILTFSHLLEQSSGFFSPLMSFFSKFSKPGDQVGSSSSCSGNVTSFRIPMLPGSHRRIDVVTTVVTKAVEQPQPKVEAIEIDSNATTTEPSPEEKLLLISKLIVPTTTSITTSVSSSNHHDTIVAAPSSSLTLPFTPNLFGVMAYVQALKDIKRNFKVQELERKIVFHNDQSGDLMTRVLRTLIHKVVNKYQKQTELLKLKILKRQEKLQNFLQLPMVAQVIASDQQELLANNLGKGGITGTENLGKPTAKSFLGSFLFR